MSYRFSSRPPGQAAALIGIGLPLLAIVTEVVTGWCATIFFDPLPSVWHLLLVLTVPAANLLLWSRARAGEEAVGSRWIIVVAGMSIAVSLTYTLLLLPILPISIIAILAMGIGFLPFAPLAAMLFTIRCVRAITWRGRVAPFVSGGVALGVLIGGVADAPATAVHLAIERYTDNDADRRSAVRLMRTLGDREMLLRLAHGETGRVTGLLGAFTTMWSRGLWSGVSDQSGTARELYYRVTGEPFNARPKPITGIAARMADAAFDHDLGGEQVGAHVPGLSLGSSRIDGSASAADNLAYVEWTVEIANAADIQNEARFTLALPEGAVASRATLWVNGEPREASVAGRGAVRAAYQKVVSASRDPLLVTTDGAGRLLVQAFPIQSHGTMKLRIGYTAPLVVASDGGRTQALPAIVERNFDIAPDLRHHVWIEGDTRSLRRSLPDAALLARPVFAASRLTAPLTRIGSVPASAKQPPLVIEQRIAPARGDATALMILLDASAPMARTGQALEQALDAVPAGLPVGLAVVAETPVTIAPAPWSPARRALFAATLAKVDYRGGQDDLDALAQAAAMVARPGGRLLWLHGAQPIDFAPSRAALEQVLARAKTPPRMIRYQAIPGRATTIQGEAMFETARMVTPRADAVTDLRAILSSLTGPVWRTDYRTAAGTGSPHIVRLWAARELAADAEATGKPRDTAIELARRLNLVTPISGAVVLETDKDYRDNDLPVPSADDVPTIPEPETWALLAILASFALWLWHRQQAQGSFRAAAL